MIAFLDAEYNINSPKNNQRTDQSLIEVALIVTENISATTPVYEYNTYVKPTLNNGIIYPHITELTGITQSNLDNAPDFPEVAAMLTQIVQAYNISTIYTWSDYDATVFRWNAKISQLPAHQKKFIKLFRDAMRPVCNTLRLNRKLSLANAVYICECPVRPLHNAISDTISMIDVLQAINNKTYSSDKLKLYQRYCREKETYFQLRNILDKMSGYGMNKELIFNNALQKKDYPPFPELMK